MTSSIGIAKRSAAKRSNGETVLQVGKEDVPSGWKQRTVDRARALRVGAGSILRKHCISELAGCCGRRESGAHTTLLAESRVCARSLAPGASREL